MDRGEENRAAFEQQWKESVAFYASLDDPVLRSQGLDDERDILIDYLHDSGEIRDLLKIARYASGRRVVDEEFMRTILGKLRLEICSLTDPERPLMSDVAWIFFCAALEHGSAPEQAPREKKEEDHRAPCEDEVPCEKEDVLT